VDPSTERLRFLADESCDFLVVRALRAVGYDVAAVAELSPRAPDADVIALAVKEQRVLLTEDKDFGQLVFAANRESGGVILIRYPSTQRARLADVIVGLVIAEGRSLRGTFAVLQPGRVRLTRSPAPSP
jgi:predicted nuclease of predicted toxin-antitoxin system